MSPPDSLSLQLIICKSYVEEGSNQQATRLLIKLEKATSSATLPTETKADLFLNIGRSKFFLGQYEKASDFFFKSYKLYESLEKWEFAASALFNSAACLHNCGNAHQSLAFKHVDQCRKLSEQHSLPGPLSHCFAFHGTHFHNQGQFSKSSDYYRKALKLIPSSESSFRKLHILSMLTFSLLQDGQFKHANHYGTQTFELAQSDKSDRFRIRYIALKAELDWQNGKIDESYDALKESYNTLSQNGISTLEELSAISQFFIKSAMLNIHVDTQIKVAQNLKSTSASWVAYQLAIALQQLIIGKGEDTEKIALECYQISQDAGFSFFSCQSLSLIILSKISRKIWTQELAQQAKQLETIAETLDFNSFKAQILLCHAARFYHLGDFDSCKQKLHDAEKTSKLPLDKAIVIDMWIQNLNGKVKRLQSERIGRLAIPMTRIFFRPSLARKAKGQYLISNNYLVSLESYPTLNNILEYLMAKPDHQATASEIQTKVWLQSTGTEGWKQKIRNSVTRLRQLFPQTIIPLITYHKDTVKLQSEIIDIKAPTESDNSRSKVIKLLHNGPMTNIELANKIDYSPSTTKRILRELKEQDQVGSRKDGRKVYYYSKPTPSGIEKC